MHSPCVSPPAAIPADHRSERRREDERFLTGQGRYLDDDPPEGCLFAAVLRSPHGHARILSVDVAAATESPGVRAVLTGEHWAADGLGALPCFMSLGPDAPLVVPPRPPLGYERVRHVGDPVALVVAESRQAAQDALELIVVDYEVEPAVTDMRRAVAEGAPQVWPEAPGNQAFRYRRGDPDSAAAAMAGAAHVVELELVNNRIAAAALEPRGATGSWDASSGRWLLRISGASVHQIRRELAEGVFRVPLAAIDVVCPDVGGGFGMKNVTYPEYALVLWAAKRLGAPVHWTAERIEDFTAGVHARDNLTTARLGLDAEGRFLALQVETLVNLGAYVSSLGPGPATTAATPAMGGLYDIPAVSMDVRGVFTNTAPVDAYRGAGKPEANFLIERLVDLAAARLGLDAVELRRRNLMRSFPHRNAMGAVIDCGAPLANLDRALLAADHAGFPARRSASEAQGRLRGLGVGCFLETSRGQPNEEAWLRVRSDGSMELAIGTQSNGQGHETSFVRLAADRLGVPAETLRLVQGDTRVVPRGGGHGGARSLHMGGGAIVLAVEDLVAKAREHAARLTQAAPADVSFEGGACVIRSHGGPERRMELAEIAAALAPEEALEGHGHHLCDAYTFPNGCHVAEVEVDPETGAVALLSYVAVDDYGRLVNPLLTEGQLHGGVAQGVGQALMEEARYEDETGQMLAATFMDYQAPRAADLPPFAVTFVEIPTNANPIGAKGVGQAGAIAAPHTVINAVLDALRPLGVTHLDMPATPERVWSAIRRAKSHA
ncbi:xanthine dehydrogenase family protein molybdopterin-binding subunit [Alsobacter soli]|uniref:xanthine dehydrogenase family protein molybdopterin-binding subunit n=1 Tax=Alsobacter soli TaxID=2109933 RepID=UPI0013048A7A|nr:xanthine dehydrogenase family protein molybdopterin-binding subunit [Alsobacter soli]